MLINTYHNCTLLISHYNRSSSLHRLLKSFKNLNIEFEEIVVSDDGSKQDNLEILNELKAVYNFKLITATHNKGLGNNINKGQDEITTTYTLYVQEDFVPKPVFKEAFGSAINILEQEPVYDMARFYAYFKFPYLKPLRDGFAEMEFKWWKPGYRKFYMYSDHPHLRRSNFLKKFGRYKEGIKGDATEYRMMMNFLQKKGKAIFFDDYKSLFHQENSEEEPSTMTRNQLRNSDNIFITAIRNVYRNVKFNFDYHFKK